MGFFYLKGGGSNLGYEKSRGTTGKAAEIAKVSIWEMQEILAQRKFPLNYYTEDLEADIKTLKVVEKGAGRPGSK